MAFLIPDYCFETVYDISPEFLLENGIKAVILDIDNTMVPYEIADATEENLKWLGGLENVGIKASFVSNNHKERVERYRSLTGLPAFYDSRKPLGKGIKAALKAMNVLPENTAIIGDQIFTDVLAGNFSGIRLTLLVKPIRDKKNPFCRFKRLLEKPLLAVYRKREKKRNSK